MLNKVVASALIHNPNDDTILAIRLNKEQEGGVLVPPGGKLETGETTRECAIRETFEELGLEIQVDRLAGIGEERYQDGEWLFVYFDAHIVPGEPVIKEEGKIMEIVWVEKENLKNFANVTWL